LAHGAWRRLRNVTLVVAACAATSEWASWLHPRAFVDVAVFPVAGVALAALLLLEPRDWHGALVGAAAAVVVVQLLHGTGAAPSVVLGLAAECEAVVGALLLRWYARGHFRLARVQDLFALIAAASLASTVGGVLACAAAAVANAPVELATAGYQHGLADFFGIIVVTPAVLAWLGTRPARGRRPSRLETVALASAVVGVTFLAFRLWADPLAYAAVLLLVWAALRFGVRGVAGAALAMVAIADWATARGTGPFAGAASSADERMLLLQVFVAVTALAVLSLAVALEERDVAELGRRVAAERFRRTFDYAPLGMAVATLDGRLVEANRALCRMLGYTASELIGASLSSFRDDPSGEHVLAARPEVVGSREQRYAAANGNLVWVEVYEARLRGVDGTPEHKIVLMRDITERKELEDQLVHAQKMGAVGRLAGGIAHDFNNVLAVMRGQAELLQDDLAVLERARARVESMQRATDRAAGLTDDLMSFSRRRVAEPVIVDLNELICSLESVILQLLGDAVALELRPGARHPAVFADPNRLEQAIVNLVLNARDAMPFGGRLTIVTSNAKPARRGGPASRLPPAVVLTVSDDGVGIDAQTQSRIFEPFFTTKPPGSGTGLGLSTTEAIVRSCQGSIAVRSEAGAGSSFVITLPGVELADALGAVRHTLQGSNR
jgi:PAS domain S-box-containing protein